MRNTYLQNTTFAMKLKITIFLLLLSTLSWGQATLPVTRTTWNSTPTGWTDSGTGSYLTAFACSGNNGGQMNAPAAGPVDDSYQVFFSGTPDQLTFVAKTTATPTGCVLLVEQSATGGVGTWTTVANLNALATTCVSYGPYTLTGTTRYVRWTYTRPINVNLTLDDVSITAPTPIITLSPTTLSGFTYTGAGPSAEQSFTVTGSTLSSDIVLTAPAGYEISLTSGSGFAGTLNLTPSSGAVATTTIYIRLKGGLIIGTYNQTLTASSGVTSQNLTLNGSVTGSSNSDVVAVSGSEAVTVSSAITNNAPLTSVTGVQVWQFKVRDGGVTLNDTDTSPTILTAFTLAQAAGNAVASWTEAINTVALFDGPTFIATGTVTATTIVFSGLSVSVADNTEKTLSIRLSMKCAAWTTTKDGQDFGFSLSNANTTFSGSGSGKAAFPALTSLNGQNAIAVVATNLAFTVQPITTGLNGAMNPSVQVKATDACGHTDIGYTGLISITSTGTMSPATNSSNASSGIAVFSTIIHTAVGTGFTLTATAPGLTNATSTTFNITNTTALQPGDVAILAFNNSTSASGTPDEISFMTFVDILPGTVIDITDNPYRKCGSPNGWGLSEGWVRFVKTNTTLPKGTVVTVRVNGGTPSVLSGDAANWTASKPQPSGQGNFDLNSSGEQIFFMSGGNVGGPSATTPTVDTGTYSGYFIFGFNTKGNVWTPICGDSAAGGTQNSGKPDFFDCFLAWPTAQADKNKYIGPITATNKRGWIERINNATNWRGYSANGGVGGYDDPAEPNFIGAVYTVNAGGFTDGLWIGDVNTNWFECGNWQALKVPDENVNVVLDANSTQKATIDATATFASLYSGIAKCKDLTISNQSVELVANSANVLRSFGDIYLNPGGTLDMDDSNSGTADGVLSFNGNWVNTSGIAAFQEGNGTVILTGNGTQTISSVAPEATETFYNLTLDNSYTTAASGNIIATNDLDVKIDRTLTISSNTYVEADRNVNVSGTLNINNSGTLYQSNDAGVNTGNISMYRDTFINRMDYVYWSSPVDNFNVNNIISGMPTGYIFNWNPVLANPNGGLGFWQNAAGSTMAAGKGYIARGPLSLDYSIKSITTALFNNGKPNTGVIQPTIERGAMTAATLGTYTSANGVPFTVKDDNYNLVGNPYPSAISANAFLTYNTTTNNVIEGAVRIWTHGTMPVSSTNPFYNSYTYNYTNNDYIVYNGTATISGPLGFNGYIGAGQGFFVLMNEGSAGTASLVFNNGMRVKGSGNNGQFYRLANAQAQAEAGETDKSRIWMDLVAPNGTVNRTVVGYVPNATLQKDSMYDAYTLGRDQQDFYSLISEEMMCIQGRPIPFDNEDLVPMGMRIPINGTYTIAISALDGLFENQEQTIYLHDKTLGIFHNLRTAPYTFTVEAGTYNDRFILRYTNGTLATEDFQNSNSVVVASGKEDLKVRSYASDISAIAVYDVLGREIFSKDQINNAEFSIQGLLANQQTLVIKIKLSNGQTVIRKTIY
jgi:hypothetical protein